MRNTLQLNNGDGSFSEIAQLSGISNSIHFMDAIDYGMSQGTKVGEWAIKRLD